MKAIYYITKAATVLAMVAWAVIVHAQPAIASAQSAVANVQPTHEPLVRAHVQSTPAKMQSAPASELQNMLVRNFQMLNDNRRTYNLYNDSIFLIRNRDLWISFFQRRAWKVQGIYESNKKILQEIESAFANDSIVRETNDYETLRAQLFHYTDSKNCDPFIFIHLGRILEKYYDSGKCPRELNQVPLLYCKMAYHYYNIFMLGNDTTYAKISYDYTKKTLDEKNKDLRVYPEAQVHALNNIISLAFYKTKVQTIDELYKYNDLYKQILQSDTTGTGHFKNGAEYKDKMNHFLRFESNIIRNAYMTDTTIMPKQKADSIMRSILAKEKPGQRANFIYLLRSLTMRAKLGDITNDEALKTTLKVYDREWRNTYKKNRLTPKMLESYILPFYTLFYFNDMASTTEAQKRKVVKRMCRNIEDAYSRRIDQQNNNSFIRYLNTLTTYERICKHLKPAERIHFLNKLNVATQVTTYAHSVHVGTLAVILTQSIIVSKPELLIGMLGCQSAKEVKKKAHEFLDYVYNAALYHDLGKNSIVSVVTNDYRPLYEEEYAIIKRHPQLGLQYLELAPELAKYHDTTLGHHKWYDGKGGYPESFDNTRSPYRTLIDIITLSDCMQAATERVGRNYRGEKTFDAVMEEFRKDVGTRYNPDLVRFIDEHQQVANTLRFNLDRGWLDIYYNIYQNFME